MATQFGNSAVFDGTTLLARLSDSNEETNNTTDDSFDYLEAGMAEGELEEVRVEKLLIVVLATIMALTMEEAILLTILLYLGLLPVL